jgi:hypothetical protein
MPSLTFEDKERVYFHLGYGTRGNIDAGDIAQVEEACHTITSDYLLLRVQQQLVICDEAWELAKMGRTGNRYTTRSAYSGDMDRAIVTENAKDFRVWVENYINETRELAQILGVPNYREEGYMAYRFARDGASFVKAIPGPPDTSVASRRLEVVQLGGSFGFM